jgi:hypothetical protein
MSEVKQKASYFEEKHHKKKEQEMLAYEAISLELKNMNQMNQVLKQQLQLEQKYRIENGLTIQAYDQEYYKMFGQIAQLSQRNA